MDMMEIRLIKTIYHNPAEGDSMEYKDMIESDASFWIKKIGIKRNLRDLQDEKNHVHLVNPV